MDGRTIGRGPRGCRYEGAWNTQMLPARGARIPRASSRVRGRLGRIRAHEVRRSTPVVLQRPSRTSVPLLNAPNNHRVPPHAAAV